MCVRVNTWKYDVCPVTHQVLVLWTHMLQNDPQCVYVYVFVCSCKIAKRHQENLEIVSLIGSLKHDCYQRESE